MPSGDFAIQASEDFDKVLVILKGQNEGNVKLSWMNTMCVKIFLIFKSTEM